MFGEVVGLGGELAVEAEETLLVWRERLCVCRFKHDSLSMHEKMEAYSNVDLVLLMRIHLDGRVEGASCSWG